MRFDIYSACSECASLQQTSHKENSYVKFYLQTLQNLINIFIVQKNYTNWTHMLINWMRNIMNKPILQ